MDVVAAEDIKPLYSPHVRCSGVEGTVLDGMNLSATRSRATRSSLASFRRSVMLAAFLLGWAATTSAQIAFGPVRDYSGAIGRIASADLDGDGDFDLVTDDDGGTRLAVLLNNGDGTFSPPIDYIVPAGTRSLSTADVNGDTHVDLILARAGLFPVGDGIISVLLNDGFGNFGSVIDYAVIVSPVAGQQLTPLSLVAGDFDGDGDADLAAAAVLLNDVGQPGYFSVIPNQGNDEFAQPIFAPSTSIDALQAFSRDIVAADLDTDLDVDLAVVSSLSNATNSVSVVLNNGDGTFGSVTNERLGGAATTALSLIVGEINGDGFIDLVTINGAHTYTVLLNLVGGTNPAKAGQFKDQGQVPLGSQALPSTDVPSGGAALRDLNGDGDRELIAGLVGDSGPGSIALFVNPGTGLLGPEVTLGPCLDYQNLVAEDLDGDGDVDLASSDPKKHRILVLLNELVPAVPPIGDSADADGDGVIDCDDGCPFDPTKTQPGVCGCAGAFIVGACDDGNPCTTGDVCSSGVCVSGGPTDCNDNNECTDDSCSAAAGCVNTPVSDRACNDGNACTSVDTCDVLGNCVGAGGLSCDDANECTDDSCDPVTGCTNVANTAPCDDGDACTVADACSSGVCVSGSAVDCDDGNPCTDDSCDSVSGCIHSPVAGRACSDGNACTEGDTCDAVGGCVAGGGVNCGDGNVCTDDSCDPATGCSHVANTVPCDDGDACTVADICSAGQCASGAPRDCNDSNVCTDDSCDPLAGCSNTANTAPCEDGDACTSGDSCAASVCVSGSATDCDDGNVCTDDSCDSITGCIHTPVPGRGCNDGNACTETDLCDAFGGCVGGAGLDCSDGNICTDDLCDPVSGCSHVANASACEDGDACTTGDVCSSSVCVSGAPTDCDDGSVCTDDSCDSATGCVNAPVADRACDDGNACTQIDTCDALGSCVGTGGVECDDANACTDDSCDPVAGCKHVANTATCDDGDACTTGDTCLASACVSGPPTVCDDDNACTDDACDIVGGCSNTPVIGRACDDGDACTVADSCDAAAACVGGAARNCDDGNECTDDSCSVAVGCDNVPAAGRACDDGRACTINDACTAVGECVGDGSACDVPIPAVSSWGLAIMVLLLLTMGTLILAQANANENVRVLR